MENGSVTAKENNAGWIKDVSQSLSDSPDALNLWLKFLETMESQGDSEAKQYIVSQIESLKSTLLSEIGKIGECIETEAENERKL